MKRFFLCELYDNDNQADVAEGVEFSDGTVVLRWLSDAASTAVHEDMHAFSVVHVSNHRIRFVRHVDGDHALRTEDRPQRYWKAYRRGTHDCFQDRCENVPFASVGGLDARGDMKAPDYIEAEDRVPYLSGYASQAMYLFGEDWQTCEFGWKHTLTIGGES